jgi:diguanylate cyclase (GGDEF)-like protein
MGWISLIYGVLSFLLLRSQARCRGTSLAADKLDLVDVLTAIQQVIAACVVLFVPANPDDVVMRVMKLVPQPDVLFCFLGAAALLTKRSRIWRSPRMRTLRVTLTILPAVIFGISSAVNDCWPGVYFCAIALLTGLLPPELPVRWQPDESLLRAEPVRRVERTAETATWSLLPLSVILGLLDDPVGVRLMVPILVVVVGITLYNITAFWLLPHLGTPARRLQIHLFAYTAVAAVLSNSVGVGPVGQGAILLLMIPPMLAAKAFGMRAAWFYLGLSVGVVFIADLRQPSSDGLAFAAARLAIRSALLVGASYMVNRSTAQQSTLIRDLDLAQERLQSANADLAAQAEELAAQQEELAAQNEALLEAADALAHAASIDSLTGLANRRTFQERLEEEVALALRSGGTGAVVFMDLDQFKYVNDGMGHTAGDQVLRRVASALSGEVGMAGSVARIGGDEFAVMIPGADADQAGAVVQGMLEALRQELLVINAEAIPVRASAGIAIYPRDGDTAEVLLSAADMAMYGAKEAGRDGYRLFGTGDARPEHCDPRAYWQREVQAALTEDRLVLYFQPIVDLGTGQTVSYEALLRLRSQAGEMIAPAVFLPAVERFAPLMHAVDRWVVRRSFAQLAECRAAGRPLALQVNLSGVSVGDPELLPLICTLLQETGVEPGSLTFEITETAPIPDIEQSRLFVQGLRDLGCGFAIDDFGAGFATFTWLKYFPATQLKVNGSLVRNLSSQPQDVPLVRALVEMARVMGIQTVAEWVDDAATYRLLAEMGVDFAQGFMLGRPGPIDVEQ